MTTNIVIVPGYHGSGEAHWQSWLQRELPQAKRVSGIDWEQPILSQWADAIVRELDATTSKTIIVAHSFGCLATARALATRAQRVAGVLLVAPADPERFDAQGSRNNRFTASVAHLLPEVSLHTQGLVIGSRNDPWMKLQHAYAWSKRWDLGFHDAGNAGHINTDSGFGPWPLIKLLTQTLCVNEQPRNPLAQLQRFSVPAHYRLAPSHTTQLLYA